jgi:hypothetical protein
MYLILIANKINKTNQPVHSTEVFLMIQSIFSASSVEANYCPSVLNVTVALRSAP